MQRYNFFFTYTIPFMKKLRNALKTQENSLLGQVKIYFSAPKNAQRLKNEILERKKFKNLSYSDLDITDLLFEFFNLLNSLNF